MFIKKEIDMTELGIVIPKSLNGTSYELPLGFTLYQLEDSSNDHFLKLGILNASAVADSMKFSIPKTDRFIKNKNKSTKTKHSEHNITLLCFMNTFGILNINTL